MFTSWISHHIQQDWSDLIRWRSLIKIAHPRARIVATNGCFDILHAGHLAMLEQSRAMGDFLVVGLNSDLAVKSLKGFRRPINNQDNRKKLLKALRCVDCVQIFNDLRATRFLEVAEPDIYVKASDYSIEKMDTAERRILAKMGTEIRFINLIPSLSTTSILKKI